MTNPLVAALALGLLAAPAPQKAAGPAPAAATASTPEQQVAALVAWAPPENWPRDRPNPHVRPLVTLGAAAVPALVAALGNPAQAYQDAQMQIVWMLGEIGDPRAFDALLKLWEAERRHGAKMRIGISVGACLDPANAKRLIVRLDAANGLPMLADITGQKLEDLVKYHAWLSVPANLEATVKSCRQRSVPQHG